MPLKTFASPPTRADLLRYAFVPKTTIFVTAHVTVGLRGLPATVPSLIYITGRDGRNRGVLFSLS
jgi:hypothetical protein